MKAVKINLDESVVPQLGQSLYKNIYGILIEYITNSYDADASTVDIITDSDKKTIIIKDDGIGMSLEELETNFTNVGINKRKEAKKPLTDKGRKVTGRKGLGKLACFGFFHCLEVETVKDHKKSKLIINYDNKKDDKGYDVIHHTASISETPENTQSNYTGTTITLSKIANKKIPKDNNLADSIAKRINLMYDGKDGFKIKIGNQIIDKKYRDSLIVDDYKFKYSIPKDIKRFTQKPEVEKYFLDNKIEGFIIAREKTSKIEENKGAVLFARGKLCQEATFFGINQTNSYGYAHLYAELYVDFIDDGVEDNIGTDRTALNDNDTTQKLRENITILLKGFATLYDDEIKKEKRKRIKENTKIIKEIEYYKKIETIVFKQENINQTTKTNIKELVDGLIDKEGESKRLDIEKIEDRLKGILGMFYSTLISSTLNYEDFDKKDSKDNIMTSYDKLNATLKKKYIYSGRDGCDLFNNIYGKTDENKYSQQNKLLNNLHGESKKSLNSAMRELGGALANLRNVTIHTNNRECYNEHINLEIVKQYASVVDLLLFLDKHFFESKD